MVHVSIQHIIGTVALIGLAVSVVLAYQIIVGYVEANVLKTQLNQVAEYVSMSFSNIISLTSFTYGILNESITVSKGLKLPADLGGKIYTIRLVNDSDGLYVLAEIPGRSNLYAKSPIPVSPATKVQIIMDENFALNDPSIKPKKHVYGGNPNIVVWCENREGVLYIGLGLREA
ncbi:MAG: hypothetical protein N3E47_03075 [Candidatus Bathyarchaeota archaeon]|nr:hypothetical protein [Candidatus Bathyarchaeota archaeon]